MRWPCDSSTCAPGTCFARGKIDAMYKEHPLFISPQNPAAKIWRYQDLPKLVSLLDRRALFFPQAAYLGDPFEGSLSRANIGMRPQVYGDRASMISERVTPYFRNMTKHTYISCWHLNDCESAALWSIYGKVAESVAVQSTFERLVRSIGGDDHDVFIGQVNYVDYDTTWIPEGNALSPFLHKRRSFEYEKELRAVIQSAPLNAEGQLNVFGPGISPGIEVPVNLDGLVEAIYVSPQAPPWVANVVRSIVSKYGINSEVVQSRLAEDPVY